MSAISNVMKNNFRNLELDEFLSETLRDAGYGRVDVQKTPIGTRITLSVTRPGLVIGPKGAEIDKLKEELENLIDRNMSLNIQEIKAPDGNAKLIAESVSEQLKKRAGFRRVMKMRIDSAMASGAKGCKIMLSGRLGGAEMARRETQLRGSIPLHTLQAHVDYGTATCRTKYGAIGIKVWLYLGRYGEEAVMVDGAPQGRGREGRRGKRG